MILMYHKVAPVAQTIWWVTVNAFYRQMVELKNKKVVYLDDYDALDEAQAVITFDGVYDNVLFYAAPIMSHFGYPFELFITNDHIGNKNEFDKVEPSATFASISQLEELIGYGGRLQWHTKSHINLKDVLDDEIIKREISVPDEIRSLDKFGFKWFAYPYGDYNSLVVELVKNNFEGALTCHQGNEINKFELNRITVTSETKLNNSFICCIIASYNYGDFLIEAIESVLRQTILPDEILISDDCSTDDTEIISKAYVKNHPNLIRFNRNSQNLGVVDHFNKAVSLTKSNLIMFLGADNRLTSNYIEETSTILNSDKKVGIAYTDYAFFGPKAKIAYSKMSEDLMDKVIDETFYQVCFPEFKDQETLKFALNKRNFIHGSSMYRRDAFEKIGGYLKSSRPEDHNLFMRMVENGWHAKKADTNLEYRQHSQSQANNIVSLNNKMLFYKKEYERLNSIITASDNSIWISSAKKMTNLTRFVKTNYKDPKKIFRKMISKIR